MSDTIKKKPKQEQPTKGSGKGLTKGKGRRQKKHRAYYAVQYYKTRKNKIRRMKRTLRHQPTNAQLESRIQAWEMDPNKGILKRSG